MLGAVIHVQFTQVKQASAAYTRMLLGLLLLTPLIFWGLGYWMDESYLSYWALSPIMFMWTPLFSATVIILILSCANNQAFLNKLFGNRWIFYLGTVSYGLYLWHAPAGKWLLDLPWIAEMEGYKFPRLVLLMFLVAIICATFSWFLVERKSVAAAQKI